MSFGFDDAVTVVEATAEKLAEFKSHGYANSEEKVASL
jgi:hypothetical protein